MTDEQLAAMHRLLAKYHRNLANEATLDVVQQYHADLGQRLADEAALIPRRTAIWTACMNANNKKKRMKLDGTRRFRRAYIEQGKGNGKSPLAGRIGIDQRFHAHDRANHPA